MIIVALLGILLATVSGLLSLIPTSVIDVSGLTANVGTISGLAGTMNGYFPIVTLGVCLGVVLALKVLMLGYRLVFFAYHQFWGSA